MYNTDPSAIYFVAKPIETEIEVFHTPVMLRVFSNRQG
jgi:hypothetical protein